jgi:hypothetical protein
MRIIAPFEAEGVDHPDIDVDLAGELRPSVFQFSRRIRLMS